MACAGTCFCTLSTLTLCSRVLQGLIRHFRPEIEARIDAFNRTKADSILDSMSA